MQNNEYISRFSHELRNPLTLIYSSLQLLEKEYPAVQNSELWPQIKKDMLDVIQLLKEMSAPFRGLRPEPLNVAEFLSGLSASFAPSMELRGIDFVTEYPDTLSALVLTADRQKLRQVLTNLILNAVDAVSGRDIPGRILLSARHSGSSVSIHVRDNGPGIPQEYLADLFEPFVTHKQGGTGLGLSVAKIIAEQHGGQLSVETRCADCNISPANSDCHREFNDGSQLPGNSFPTYTDFCLLLPLTDREASLFSDVSSPDAEHQSQREA